MLDPKQISSFDQASSSIIETIPSFIRNLYLKFVEEGFSEQQSMELVKTYLQSMTTK